MPSPILHVLTGVGIALVALAKRPRRAAAKPPPREKRKKANPGTTTKSLPRILRPTVFPG